MTSQKPADFLKTFWYTTFLNLDI